jgi:membrane-bound ClpP family serine protease
MSMQQPPNVPQASTNGLAVTSMILGIVGIIFSFFGIYGIIGAILGIAAVVLSIVGKKQIDASGGAQKGANMSIAGLVTGIIAIVFGVIVFACTLACIGVANEATRGLNELEDALKDLENWYY